ncbi:hypothetical protein DK847_14135 [Aestuariivirga litoralis]|uniref:Uncharacterized protein n=1 Tax=Aestuariivirga litoralis TaxID=2650924 RepID=A0A2W2AS26_9HYPH|nr:hypothetical protein DK847_14135 [Aestuariivirga litoralis]
MRELARTFNVHVSTISRL